MRKISFSVLLLMAFVAIYLYSAKLYYPAAPIESISKKELVTKGKQATNELVYVTNENGFDWYIVHMDSPQATGALIQQRAAQDGWQFTEQLGSGYIFKKEQKTLIITVKMWSSQFQLVQVQENTLQ